jgi:hypothetical protein
LRAIMAKADFGENVADRAGAGGAGAVVVPKAFESGPRAPPVLLTAVTVTSA